MEREQRDSTLHECGETYCSNCHQYYLGMDHLCHMRSITTDSICDKLIFYDFECQQEEGIHKPNFVVVQTVCDVCESQPLMKMLSVTIVVIGVKFVNHSTLKKMNMKGILVQVVVRDKKFSMERKLQMNSVIG